MVEEQEDNKVAPEDETRPEKQLENALYDSDDSEGQGDEESKDETADESTESQDDTEDKGEESDDKEEESEDKGEDPYANLEMPENFELNDDGKAVLAEIEASPENAQKLVEYAAKLQNDAIDAVLNEVEQQKADWAKETMETCKDQISPANQFIEAHAPEGVKELFAETGLGNHPLMVKMFAACKAAISEAAFEKAPSSEQKQEVSFEEALYGN